jgi:hypothetical protein
MTGGDTLHAAAAWRTEETEPFSICLLRLITRTIRCEAVVGTALTSIGLVAEIAGVSLVEVWIASTGQSWRNPAFHLEQIDEAEKRRLGGSKTIRD